MNWINWYSYTYYNFIFCIRALEPFSIAWPQPHSPSDAICTQSNLPNLMCMNYLVRMSYILYILYNYRVYFYLILGRVMLTCEYNNNNNTCSSIVIEIDCVAFVGCLFFNIVNSTYSNHTRYSSFDGSFVTNAFIMPLWMLAGHIGLSTSRRNVAGGYVTNVHQAFR